MLAIQSVSIRAGLKPLFENASLTIHPGQKIGLIGQNGVGKTTLFKAIMGEIPLEAGQISIPANWLIGYVEQEVADSDLCALDYVCFGDTQYALLTEKIHQAQESGDHDALVKAYDEMDRIAGYEVSQKAQQLLAGLGFSVEDLTKPIQAFSGGWQVRLKLGRALMQRSDLLLLDEPTNHLDIEAVAWLIQWLKSYQGAVLIISHDRDFLDQVVQGIAHIQQQKINYYSGNFAAFERQRNEQLMQQQALHEKQKQQMQHLKTFIERFKAKASKAKQAQSRVKALERMEQVAAVQATNPFHFEFFEPKHQPDPMVKVEGVSFGYGDKVILEDASLVLRAGDRIGLVGVNGSGKTTLIKLLVGEVKPSSGLIQMSKGVSIGYFAQHQLEALELDHSPLQHMLALSDEISDQQARDFLGQFGFSNEQTLTPVRTFSGGEKARLALAMIVYLKPNLIILDEPTNHLDMDTRDALDMALQEFGGALILVTHDKHLLASIADQFWWVHEGKITLYHGDLESYLQTRLKTLKQSQEALKSKSDRPVQNKKQQRQQNAQRRKQLDVQLKPYNQALKKVEKQMDRAQAELAKLHELMEDSSLYEAENKAKLTEAIKLQAEYEKLSEESEMEWLELQEQIEQITKQFDEQDEA
ncbi:ribosomal protection-like ABC-F family protein [Thiomicrorhabdus sp.]|uniref:ribosomal protection-like ABC-F family protein n=1 Tax=Thiomicrorhabdus sp. TaxID=2039724 RepID=UPI0035617DE5